MATPTPPTLTQTTTNDFNDTWPALQVATWLAAEFPELVSKFTNKSGKHLAKYSKEDLIAICGEADGRALYNEIHPNVVTVGGWKRNLTMECIEPNPGPAMGIFFDDIAARFGVSYNVVRHDLHKIEVLVEAQPAGKYGHTEKEVASYFANLSLEQFATIVESSVEDAKSIYDEIRKKIGLAPPPGSQAGPSSRPDPEIIHFVEELRNSIILDDVLELENGATFFGWEPWGSKLYVRHAYEKITDRIFKEDLKRTLIIGNPGIGKTCYLFYLLKILLDQNATVVYQRHSFENWYLFTPDGQVTCGPKTVLPSKLKDPNTWYLIDTDAPLQHRAKVVMVSSPCKDHYNDFMKLDVCVMYMPIFSLAEIHACREIIRPHKTVEEVNKLYSRWGGIPRYVLELTEPKHKAQQHSLDKAIQTADLQRIIRYIGDEDAPEDASHKIVHMISDEGYSKVHMQLASPYVAQAVVELFVKQKRDDLITFLSTSDVDSEKAAVLRGNMFEGFAHQQIQAGGRFRTRNLETQQEQWFEVEPKRWCFFHKSADIVGIQESHYLKPYSPRFCAIDALMAKPACFLQITLSSSHAVLASMLRQLIAVFRKVFPRGKIALIFVVPESIFPTFRKQSYKRKSSDTSAELETEQPDMADLHADIEQYALALPLLLERKEHTIELPQLEVRQLPAAACDENKCGFTSSRGNMCEHNKATCFYHSPAGLAKKAAKRKKVE